MHVFYTLMPMRVAERISDVGCILHFNWRAYLRMVMRLWQQQAMGSNDCIICTSEQLKAAYVILVRLFIH